VAGSAHESGSDCRSPAADLLSVLVQLSFARDLGSVTGVTRTAVRRLTGADGVTFVLRDGHECLYADEEAIAPLWKGRRFPLDQCVSGWVMLHRRTAVIPDIYADQRVPHDAYRPTFVQSLLMVPIREEDPVGAIGVYWASRHEATPEQVSLVQAVANGAALALANVRLVMDLEEAAERERTARVAAERANRLTDRILDSVSHELRTPLGVVQGWLWQLRQPVARGNPDLLDQGLAVMDRNVGIQAGLIEDLIDASRAVAGSIVLRRRLVDLNAVCRLVAEAERPAAQSKAIALDVHAGPAPLPVYGDTGRLQQILSKLIDNAIKFTPAGGRVVICTGRANGRVRLSVRDTGIGIAPSLRPHVFDSFRSGDKSHPRETGGLGLGLTIAHELVRLHGGWITADSGEPGCGTTMTVELPVPAVLAQPGEPLPGRPDGSSEAGRLAGRRVLVIEDDAESRAALQRVLEAQDATVTTARSADDAVERLASVGVDLVLAGVGSTGRGEWDAVGAVRFGDASEEARPIVLLSSCPERELPDVPSALSVRLVLEKPIDPEELTTRLASLLVRPALRSSNAHGSHAAHR
jgi:signal transduction histidine kinase